MVNKNFLTIDEVAKSLNITRQTISKFIQKKKLNAVKINKSYRITYNDFEKFLNQNATVSDVNSVYLKKSRNCLLDYEGRTDEDEIINAKYKGSLQNIEINHNHLYNKFILGDNYNALKYLLPEIHGKVDLIYIDPPFGTGQDYIDMENDLVYSDCLINQEFLEFLRKRLILLRECLSEQGSIYLHIDKKIGHYVKVIMDEIFGYKSFINDITRIKCNPKNFARNAFGNYTDVILFYVKNRDMNIFNDVKEQLTNEEIKKLFSKSHPKLGRYTTHPLHAPSETINGDTGKEWNSLRPPKGRHWRYSREELTRLNMQGLIEWSETGNPRKMVFVKDHKGKKVQDVWEFKDKGLSYVDYPTQKNHDMLKRIILNSSNEGSLALDCFAGSGGTLLVADQLRRQWIGIDNSLRSLEAVKENFQNTRVDCNYYNFISSD